MLRGHAPMPLASTLPAALCLALAGTPSDPPPAPRVDRPTEPGPQRTARVGGGLMAGGGTLMVVGAAVLVPMGVLGAARAEQPDPRDYTAVEPFRQDMLAYQSTLERSMTLGVAGSITAVVGATAFVAGAVTWGVGRRRMRRSGLSLMLRPDRRGMLASIGGRF
ncbi:MAG: hypothetical protein KDK70_35165 [Myxococcales bacterium]|nr:hypothetical protein [Myxococcales bacterium]